MKHIDKTEVAELLSKTLNTGPFRNAPMRRSLLEYHVAHLGEHRTTYDIWTQAFGNHPDTYHESAIASIRERQMDERRALEEASRGCQSGWVFRLHPAVPGKGYQLEVVEVKSQATRAFWQGHIRGDVETLVIHNEPLFFRDAGHTMLVRYPTASCEMDRVPPTLDATRTGPATRPTRPFITVGEMQAERCLLQYFDRNEGVLVDTCASHRMNDSDLSEISPVLLGNPRNNPLVKELFRSRQHRNLGYRMAVDGRSFVEVANPTAVELNLFAVRGAETRQGSAEGYWGLADDPEGYAFALVVRLPNLHGGGPITMLLSDYPRALPQIAKTLTQETLLRPIFDVLGWGTHQVLPESFQWIFAVDLGHEGFGHSAHRAEFIGCRSQGDTIAQAHAA